MRKMQSNEGIAEVKAVIDDTERLYAYRALTTHPLVVEAGLSRTTSQPSIEEVTPATLLKAADAYLY